MDEPKNWKDCTIIARNICVPPQIIAKAYGINQSTIIMKRSTISDRGLQLLFNFDGACARGEIGEALVILREFFEKNRGNKSDSEYVFQQATYLKDEDLAFAALKRMIVLTPQQD
jgi:hypothetical protein